MKVLRWLLPVTVLLAGCGLLPTTSTPTQSAAPPAGQTSQPATNAPTVSGATPAGQPGQPGQAGTTAATAPLPPSSPSPSPSPTAVPRTTVRLGTSSTLGGWIVDVADRQGFFANLGIVLDRKEADPGSAANAEAVEKRERDVAVLTTDRLVQVGRNGQGLVMVAGLVNKAPYSLVAARDVESWEALKGKPIGYLDEKSAMAAILKRMLKLKGISEAQSRLIAFPDPGVVGAAVSNGTVGASLVDTVRAARLRANGFNVLLEASEVANDFQAEGLVVRPEWARQNEELVTRFIRATILAERWVLTPANRQGAIEQLSRSLGVSVSEAEVAFKHYVEDLASIPREGDITQGGVRGVIELLAEIDALPDPRPDPARLVDTTLLQRAKQIVGSSSSGSPGPSGAPSPGPAGSPSPGASGSPSPKPAGSPPPR